MRAGNGDPAMTCQRCQTENPDGNKYCGKCGAEVVIPGLAVPVPGESGAYYCAKHTKVVTRLRCGRCEKPICIKCTVQGAAGARCRECSKNKIGVRPMGVVHEAGRILDNTANTVGRRSWLWTIIYFIISLFRGGFGR